jgi:ABC-type bacteriocin/lantibiotic exporter with double-glycine peptidase domain
MVLEGWQIKQNPLQPQPVPEQCALASKRFPGKNCCERGCEQGIPLEEFEDFLQNFRPKAKQVGNPMKQAELQPKISEGPVIVAWTNPNHFVVVVDMTGDTIEICDPEPNGGASGQISFSQLENPIYNGKPREWVDTFVDLWS